MVTFRLGKPRSRCSPSGFGERLAPALSNVEGSNHTNTTPFPLVSFDKLRTIGVRKNLLIQRKYAKTELDLENQKTENQYQNNPLAPPFCANPALSLRNIPPYSGKLGTANFNGFTPWQPSVFSGPCYLLVDFVYRFFLGNFLYPERMDHLSARKVFLVVACSYVAW
ncbi:hypothetical protein ACFLX2_00450 [Candidatus Dependentiae bacterium]